MDDFYVLDTTGAKNNDFLRGCKSRLFKANGGGIEYGFYTIAREFKYENVDENHGPDDDSTYNQGSDVGEKDTYTIDSLPSPNGTTIYGVKSQITAKKTRCRIKGC